MARPPHNLKKDKLVEGVSGLRILQDLGIKIHKLKLHAKVLPADGERELSRPAASTAGVNWQIEVRDKDVVDRIHEVLKHDWENSHPLDLSDEGLQGRTEGRRRKTPWRTWASFLPATKRTSDTTLSEPWPSISICMGHARLATVATCHVCQFPVCQNTRIFSSDRR